MKLGMITTPNAGGIKRVNSFGLKYAEFDINIGMDLPFIIGDKENIKAACRETGVSVGAIGRWGPDRINSNGIIESELENEKMLIEFASYLGCPVYISGCNFVEELSYYANCTYAIEYLGQLIAYGEKFGVKICTYNCNWNSFVNCDPAWTLIHGHLPALGIKFDPSHSLAGGRDYMAEAEKWGGRFYHVHLKGSLYVNGEHIDDPPAGLDNTDWPSLMALLYKKNYDGMLAIEPHSPTWRGELGEKGIAYTVRYFKNLIF